MTVAPDKAALSPLDEARFGVKTAKATIADVRDVPEVMEFCSASAVEFLIARCPTHAYPCVHAMERLGFLLMDTLVYYAFRLDGASIPGGAPDGLSVGPVRPGEEHRVRDIARESFSGYLGHYHADPRLDPGLCDEVYTDWAYRSCIDARAADAVIVARSGDEPAGFGTMRANDAATGEGLLFAVAPAFRGRGVYRAVMLGCLDWCRAGGMEQMIISTQVTNLASQKTWSRLGFEPASSWYTFHRWFS
ncbi:MAG TPA: GNAT family N-acetyltransferase [Deltaproteobacteria bacterium]|nr:GNAT family N-acetyltransferase [Deltaproteobacteria bacterium]HQI82397.1 GNAT family N-acetyltransferase [Deltaproteobacteria bacterium]